jgi:hypothetical protein
MHRIIIAQQALAFVDRGPKFGRDGAFFCFAWLMHGIIIAQQALAFVDRGPKFGGDGAFFLFSLAYAWDYHCAASFGISGPWAEVWQGCSIFFV